LSSHWLDVIGIGADGPAGLAPELRQLVAEAHLVVGGRRHLDLVADLVSGEAVPWSTPIAATMDRLVAQRGRPPAVVLASGDPLWFGVGRLLLERFSAGELAFHPGLSAFQLAAARLAWPLADVACLSLHGRSLDQLNRHLAHGRRLLILTRDGAAPAAIGGRLARAGFGRSTLTVLEFLGAAEEAVVSFRADEAAHRQFGDLNTLAVLLEADDVWAGRAGHGIAQGLPDACYLHDGQLTKQEVRAVTLAKLAPRPGQHLWDIGAGAGSIAIEWLLAGRAAPDLPTTATAVEASADRVAVIIENAHNLGVPQLAVIEGTAPRTLPGDPDPDAVFIGGGVAAPMLIEACLDRLKPGGRLVVNAVTLGGEARLLDLQRRHGGDLSRIAISRAEPIGRTVAWKSMVPVTQWTLIKVSGDALA
jgi:precorrin-6Y C5,15-methyltransferase (decarboxylating)